MLCTRWTDALKEKMAAHSLAEFSKPFQCLLPDTLP